MKNKELLRVIDKVAETGQPILKLGGQGLTALPPEIGKLTRLKSLDVSGNQLTTLPPEIGNLSRLEVLDVSNNPLEYLPPELGSLSSLVKLDLDWNYQSFPEPIVRLQKLTWLRFYSRIPVSLPAGISQLVNLGALLLTSVKEIPPEVGRLQNLRRIEIFNSDISSLPPELERLVNLDNLTLAQCPAITHLPESLCRLQNLTTLMCDGARLTALPEGIGQLRRLETLSFSQNLLTAVPGGIGRLVNLKNLWLDNNKLTALPKEIGELTGLGLLNLRGNPLPIPPEILDRSNEPQAIISYYLQHLAGQKRALSEAKVLVVGQSFVGKTSLIKRLVEGEFDRHENKTEGINIRRWELPVGGEPVRLNVWDFGGQEIMHATHQFFLTKRSLYVLVIDARQDEDENRLEYWLKIIQSFGGDSPVIVVGNKIDQQPLDLDRRGLQAKYVNIRAFVETSCLDGRGLETLRQTIEAEVGKLEHIHDQLLATWFSVKTRLEALKEDYIPYSAYVQLCREEGVDDEVSQRTLIGFLHDLGVVLNFYDDQRFKDTNVLNPEWVTGGVYKILNSNELFQAKGVLDRPTLALILDPRQYPADKHPFIMGMMRKFELCFDFEGFPDERFLIPDLLSKEEPYTGEWGGALAFQYRYNVLPSSIISRFIVRLHPFIYHGTLWRTGVVLAYEQNTALVKADLEDEKITILVGGPEHTRRALLAVIRSNFEAIHKTIPGIVADEKVPVPEYPSAVVDYKHLLRLERMGETAFIPEGMSQRVSVAQLLDGVETEQARQTQREMTLLHRMIDKLTKEDGGATAAPAAAADEARAVTALSKVKQSLDTNSERYARRGLMLCFFVWLAAWAGLAALIFWLGWEVMEKWTYLIGTGVPLTTYLYFAATRREFSPATIYQHVIKRKRAQLYRANGFDLEAYHQLAGARGRDESGVKE